MVAAWDSDQRIMDASKLRLPRLVEQNPGVAVGHLLLARELAGRLKTAEAEAELP